MREGGLLAGTWMSTAEHGEVCLWERKRGLAGEVSCAWEPRGSSLEGRWEPGGRGKMCLSLRNTETCLREKVKTKSKM